MKCLPAKILLIDDDPEVERIIAASLGEDLPTLCAVRDGLSGLALARRQPFDLILLDLGLPDLNGFEILRQLKADTVFSSLPVIVLTAWDSISDKVRGFDLGATDYIAKLVRREGIQAALEHWDRLPSGIRPPRTKPSRWHPVPHSHRPLRPRRERTHLYPRRRCRSMSNN